MGITSGSTRTAGCERLAYDRSDDGRGWSDDPGGWPSLPEFNFVGAIDDFRIFSWALTLQEVLEIYQSEVRLKGVSRISSF